MTAPAQQDNAPAPAPPMSFKALFLKGSFWSIAGNGASQVVGLVGGIIVWRLLWPEALGTMLIVNSVLIGLAMFSDIGLSASVIQNRRGEDPRFLQTAWTMNVIRGVILWVLSIPLGFIMARIVDEPILAQLVPVAGLTIILGSLFSPSLLVLRRRIQLSRLFALEFAGHAIQVTVMVTLAWLYRSIWALVAASLVSHVFKLTVSHTWLSCGYRMRFGWDREAAREIFHFGFWVFFSSMMTFLVGRFDVFVLGSLLGTGLVGVYGNARKLTRALVDVVMRISNGVLFPLYSRIAEHDKTTLRRRTLRFRAVVLGVALPPLWALAVLGPYFIRIAFGETSEDATWMVRYLAAGAVMTVICQTIEPVLLAMGDSFRHMVQLGGRFTFQVGGVFAGYYLGGVQGLIIGLAMADLLGYPLLVSLVRKYNVWLPHLDLAAAAVSASVIGLGWYLLGFTT